MSGLMAAEERIACRPFRPTRAPPSLERIRSAFSYRILRNTLERRRLRGPGAPSGKTWISMPMTYQTLKPLLISRILKIWFSHSFRQGSGPRWLHRGFLQIVLGGHQPGCCCIHHAIIEFSGRLRAPHQFIERHYFAK